MEFFLVGAFGGLLGLTLPGDELHGLELSLLTHLVYLKCLSCLVLRV